MTRWLLCAFPTWADPDSEDGTLLVRMTMIVGETEYATDSSQFAVLERTESEEPPTDEQGR